MLSLLFLSEGIPGTPRGDGIPGRIPGTPYPIHLPFYDRTMPPPSAFLPINRLKKLRRAFVGGAAALAERRSMVFQACARINVIV